LENVHQHDVKRRVRIEIKSISLQVHHSANFDANIETRRARQRSGSGHLLISPSAFIRTTPFLLELLYLPLPQAAAPKLFLRH